MKQKQKFKDYKKKRDLYEKRLSVILKISAAVFFLGITAFYPLYLVGEHYTNINVIKTFFFCLFTGIAAAGIAIIFIVLFFLTKRFHFKDYYTADEPNDKSNREIFVFEWEVIIFIVFTFASTVFSRWQTVAWDGFPGRNEGFRTILCYVLTFFIAARFYRAKRLHFLIFAGSAFLVSLYGILQFTGHDIFGLFPFTYPSICDADGNPVYGSLTAFYRTTLGNIDVVSSYCSLAVVLFAALFTGIKSKWSGLYLAASIMTFALLLISDTDAGKVGVLIAMVLLIPFWIFDRMRLGKIFVMLSGWCAVYAGYNIYLSVLKKQSETRSFAPMDYSFLQTFKFHNPVLFGIIAAILLAAGLCLILIIKKWPPTRSMKIAGIVSLIAVFAGSFLFVEIMGAKLADQPYNIIWQAREMLHGRFSDYFGSGRGWIWKRGTSVLFNNPVFGTGPDTFYYALGDALQNESVQTTGVTVDKAHNIFIQTAVCMGIPAFLAYAVFLFNLFFSAVKKAFDRPILFACAAGALSYSIQSFFGVEVPIVTPLYWAVLGVIAGEIRLGKID